MAFNSRIAIAIYSISRLSGLGHSTRSALSYTPAASRIPHATFPVENSIYTLFWLPMLFQNSVAASKSTLPELMRAHVLRENRVKDFTQVAEYGIKSGRVRQR